MALIPRKVRNFMTRWSAQQRADMVLLPLAEAKAAAFNRREEEKKAQAVVAAEAIQPQLFSLTAGDGEDAGFRRITSLPNLRDLNPMMHDRMQQVCYYLRVTTPFGKRIVEIITSYSVGKGVKVTATDTAVQDVIDKFWKDDVNKIDEQLAVWCDELTTFGELCLPFARRESDGFVRLGYVDPMNVEGIVFSQMQTAMGTAALTIPYGVQLRREVGDSKPLVMPIVSRCEDPMDANYGYLQGECFYHAINKAKSASRGFSELFSLADWIDVFDQMMFDFADRVRLINAFVWHYTVTGADDATVQQFKNKLTKEPPRQGGLQVTNEKVQIESKTPEFHGGDMSTVASTVKKYGMGGAGLGGAFFADGDDANRAAMLEMNAPAVKKFQDRQNNLAALISNILNFVIDSAIRAGVLPENVDRSFAVQFPEIAVKDLQKGATTLQGVTSSLSVGQAEGWITGATAARCFHTILAELGCDIDDSQAEYNAAQEEKNGKAAAEQERFASQLKLAEALKMNKPPVKELSEPSEPEEVAA